MSVRLSVFYVCVYWSIEESSCIETQAESPDPHSIRGGSALC